MSEQKEMSTHDLCVKEINEVLVKYQMALHPTFQLLPVVPKTEEVEEETETDEEVESEVVSSTDD